MPTPPIRLTTGITDLYVLFRGTTVAVPATAGSGFDAVWYSASDAAIIAKSLPVSSDAGYDGVYLHGDPNSPNVSDAEEGVFGAFH
jgi:hypothetical protein